LTVCRDVLDDGGYHSIFEALFQVARAEKQAYLAAKNPGQKTKAERALTACSDVLRITIRVGADKLKYKTVQAVIEHVTQLLPVATGEYCAGLSQFYLKTLGSLFEHEAHVEHLKDDDWLSIVDFCLQGIEQYNLESSSEIITSSRTFSNLTATTSSSAHTSNTKLSMRTVSDGNPANSVTKRNSEELLHCLVRLISPSNAPVHERAEPIFHGIMQFLNSHGSFVSSIHQVAFSGLNSMLAATTADRTGLSQSLALHLIPIISHLWSLKLASKDEMLNSVKDEMLITILVLRLPMEHILDSPDAVDFRSKTENLEVVLRMEYMKRLQSDQLQLDDLDMAISVEKTSPGTSIHAGTLRLRSFTPRAERNWAILTVLSILDRLLHTGHEPLASNIDDNNEEVESLTHPRKRRRIARRFDSFVTRIASQNSGEQTVALQTLFFLLPETELSQQDLDELLEHLARRVVDRQRYIGSWAMLCIAR
jgi:serine-protein kinase ATM